MAVQEATSELGSEAAPRPSGRGAGPGAGGAGRAAWRRVCRHPSCSGRREGGERCRFWGAFLFWAQSSVRTACSGSLARRRMLSGSGAGRPAVPDGTNPPGPGPASPGRCRWQLAVAAQPLVSFLLLLLQAKGAGCSTPCQPRAFPSVARQSPLSNNASVGGTNASRAMRSRLVASSPLPAALLSPSPCRGQRGLRRTSLACSLGDAAGKRLPARLPTAAVSAEHPLGGLLVASPSLRRCLRPAGLYSGGAVSFHTGEPAKSLPGVIVTSRQRFANRSLEIKSRCRAQGQ